MLPSHDPAGGNLAVSRIMIYFYYKKDSLPSTGKTVEMRMHYGLCSFCRRRHKLETEAQAREAEIQAFQRQHWQEMKGAAARNRAALLVR